jgi:hypothetical protein
MRRGVGRLSLSAFNPIPRLSILVASGVVLKNIYGVTGQQLLVGQHQLIHEGLLLFLSLPRTTCD